MDLKEKKLIIKTPAKLNLGLRVGPPLASGYHGLETVFQTVNLTDTISLQPAQKAQGTDSLVVEGSIDLPVTDENLVIKAVNFLRDQGMKIPVLEIKLLKQIPIGAGLGGGSGNAAGVLKSFEQLFEQSFTSSFLLSQVATQLGADVPFFLWGGTARAAGIGEQLLRLPDQQGAALICLPELSIATEQAYDQLDKLREGKAEAPPQIVDSAGGPANKLWKNFDLQNDFWLILKEQFPQMVELHKQLAETTDYVSLTGSGSALYGLYDDLSEAREAGQKVAAETAIKDWYAVEFTDGIQVESVNLG